MRTYKVRPDKTTDGGTCFVAAFDDAPDIGVQGTTANEAVETLLSLAGKLPVTAPTPERRVGEARVAEWAAGGACDGFTDLDMADPDVGRIVTERNDLAADLLDARAEVERQKQLTEFMRKAGEMFLYAVEGEGICEVPSTETRDLFRWALAALSLPTEPEVTNDQS